MTPALRQPKWIIAGVVVLALAALFVRLGFWQLSRLEETKAANAQIEERFEMDPVPIAELTTGDPVDLRTLEYRKVFITGEFDTAEEVLIRSQVELGQAGFHVITPLVRDDETAVLVNRGWVPLTLDSVPVAEAIPASGQVDVQGWVQPSQTRPPLGTEEPPGRLEVFNRVDVDRIEDQMPYELSPFYLVAVGESDNLPLPLDSPDFTNEGSHLAYAIQWFGFAAVGVVGFFFLYRNKGISRRDRRG